MKKIVDIKRIKFYVWVALAFLLIYSFGEFFEYPDTILQRIVNSILLLTYLTVLNFILFEHTLPFIRLSRERLFVSLLLIAAHVLLYSVGLYAWRYGWIKLHVYTSFRSDTSLLRGVAVHTQFSIATILFFGVVRHIYNYIELINAAKQLRIEKQEAELNYLKSQTNPHFLFNTLNNIYSLARDKSDLTAESVMRLSKILRFMLYEAGGDYIAIEQELKIINDYIALEKLRYDESLRIEFNQEIDDIRQQLPPLLLMPLVENAFKHGVSETREQPFIAIHLSVSRQQLLFVVKNSTEMYPVEEEVKENIGLSNLRRQLQLLYAEYELFVQQDQFVFTATLKINLGSHV